MRENNNTRFPEWYLLRITNRFKDPALTFFSGLSENEKSLLKIKEESEKALRAGFKKIALPWNFTLHSASQELLCYVLKNPSVWVLQVPLKNFNDFKNQNSDLLKNPHLTFDFLLQEIESLALLKDIESLSHFQISIPALKGIPIYDLAHALPECFRAKTCVHFPCFHKTHAQLYSSDEIFSFLKEKFFPPPRMDASNLSIPYDLKLEPEGEPEFFWDLPKSHPLMSVIIPSYNSKTSLLVVLEHLARQSLSRELFEVIVIDDGSRDHTESALKKAAFLKSMNFKFLKFLRERRRRFFDHRFRAGIARNLGVKQAQGEILTFLDSDVLVGEDFLDSILKAMQNHNVIQHPRYHLKPTAPRIYSKIKQSRHTFVRGDSYWERFYDRGSDWNNLSLPWKYVSTNTLSVKTETFKKVGRFRKNYTSYGFEDTDLGFRLYHAGEKFFLNPKNTYHIFRRSEFFHLPVVKRHLLGMSANVFFHNTHSLEGFKEFRHLISKRGR